MEVHPGSVHESQEVGSNAGYVEADALKPLLQAAGYTVLEGRWSAAE